MSMTISPRLFLILSETIVEVCVIRDPYQEKLDELHGLT